MKDFVKRLWKVNQQTLCSALDTLTEENKKKRITANMRSAGFNMRHIAETQYALAKAIFGVPTDFEAFTFRTDDDGRDIDLEELRQFTRRSGKVIEEAIEQIGDAQWNETVKMPIGEISRLEAVGFLMNHTMHHTGQVMQAIKYGL